MGIEDRDYMRERARRRIWDNVRFNERTGDLELDDPVTYARRPVYAARDFTLTIILALVLIAMIAWLAREQAKLTIDKFNRIAIGAPTQSAADILGRPADNSLQLTIAGHTIDVSEWKGSSSKSIGIASEDGQILMKMQTGLDNTNSAFAGAAEAIKADYNQQIEVYNQEVRRRNAATRELRRLAAATTPQYAAQPQAASTTLVNDKPFPANGSITRSIPLRGMIARLRVQNLRRENISIRFLYNVGQGDQEAARLYLQAGQSANIDLPSFDYRAVMTGAPTNYGLERGHGEQARLNDLGFYDLKAPSQNYRQPAILRIFTSTYATFSAPIR